MVWLGIIGALLATGCFLDDKTTAPETQPEEAQTKAQEAEDAFTTALNHVRDMEEGSLEDVDFTQANGLYKEAIALDPSNTEAQFGAAVTELLVLAQNEDVQVVEDSLRAFTGEEEEGLAEKPLLGVGLAPNAKRIAMMPRIVYRMGKNTVQPRFSRKAAKPVGEVRTASDVQRIIEETFIPAVDYALARLTIVEGDPDFQFIITPELQGDAEEDPLELDLGEVYVLDAQLRTLKAFLLVATAYNLDFDEEGSYDFLEDLSDAEILRQLMRLDQDSDFLTLRSSNNMPKAGQNLLTAVEKLEKSVAFIRAEEDDQSDDLIKQRDLDDLDAEIDLSDEADAPDFFRDIVGIEKALSKLREVLSGPVDIDADFNDDGQEEILKVNLSAFFYPPVQDLRKLLPHHEWYPGNFDNMEIYDDFALTDAYGNTLGENDPPFVLPDPTFGGLLPDLTTNQAFFDFFDLPQDGGSGEFDLLDRSVPGRIFVSNETLYAVEIQCFDSETEEQLSSKVTVAAGESKEVSEAVIRGDTDVKVEVAVQIAGQTYTQNLWIWMDGDVTIHIYPDSEHGIRHWEEYERWD
jgi:hypothetical protein